MKPHKYAGLIKQWADGAVIEWRAMPGDPEWKETKEPGWKECLEYRVKPEKVYPETRLDPEQLRAEYNSDFQGTSEQQALVRIVNFGLRHAIDAGQLLDPSTYMADVRELAANRNARRDMAIAEAVKAAAFHLACLAPTGKAADRIYEMVPSAIIATVKD